MIIMIWTTAPCSTVTEGDPGGSLLPQQRHRPRPGRGGAAGEDLDSHQRPGPGSVRLVSPRHSQLSSSTFRFSYYGAELSDYGKIDKVVTMFNDLFGKERFELGTLVREVLSL